jgi:hypothetical protein
VIVLKLTIPDPNFDVSLCIVSLQTYNRKDVFWVFLAARCGIIPRKPVCDMSGTLNGLKVEVPLGRWLKVKISAE